MPLALLMIYGSMGGLASVLLGALVKPFLPGLGPEGQAGSDLTLRECLEAGTHLAAGAGIAVLYQLSWGFAALVSIPWWGRGLAFGMGCWLALVLPLVLASTLKARSGARVLAALASEWLCTCLLAALACAYSWQTGPA